MTLLCGVAVALVASLTSIEKLAFLCNIGTLFAFFLVCLALMLSMPASSWWRLALWLLIGLRYTSSTTGAPAGWAAVQEIKVKTLF